MAWLDRIESGFTCEDLIRQVNILRKYKELMSYRLLESASAENFVDMLSRTKNLASSVIFDRE